MTNQTTKTIEATVIRNLEHDGLEITFSDVPSAKVRTALKSNGFRWHNGKHVWYAKYNDKHVEFIKKMKWELPEDPSEEEPEVEPEVTEAANPVDLATALSRIADLERELAEYKATFAKVPKDKKTENAILKRVLSEKNLDKAHKYADGFGFTNGHMLITDKESHGIEVAEKSLDIASLLKGIKDAKWELEVDIADLKKFIKEHKPSEKAPYILEQKNAKIAFNPRYMIDALTWCGTSKIWINSDLGKKSPIYILGDARQALVLPINVK